MFEIIVKWSVGVGHNKQGFIQNSIHEANMYATKYSDVKSTKDRAAVSSVAQRDAQGYLQ